VVASDVDDVATIAFTIGVDVCGSFDLFKRISVGPESALAIIELLYHGNSDHTYRISSGFESTCRHSTRGFSDRGPCVETSMRDIKKGTRSFNCCIC
jgi:hypothetical protein